MNQHDSLISFSGFTVLIGSKAEQQVIFTEIKAQLLASERTDLMIVQKNWPFFPYLNLKEQVFLDIPEKQKKAKQEQAQDKLMIDSSLLKKSVSELSTYERIKLQLMHAILADKNKLIIEDPIDDLSIIEIQDLLTNLCDLVNDHSFSILLLTHDLSIAERPYVTDCKEAS